MEAVGQLAGGVAHDFNNILAAITGFAGLLMDDFEEKDARRSDVEEILKSTRRAAGLIRQLLAFSRTQVLQPRALDLNRVVTDTVAMLRPLLGAPLRLVTLPARTEMPVYADRTQLEQVLMNLILNARDAMPEGGALTIEVAGAPAEEATPPSVTLSVSDTGRGMAPEVAARAFEPFFTTKARGHGTGLGLATVHGIVEQSGGTVRLESQQGRGTTITISLPLTQPAPAVVAPVPESAPNSGRGTVLVVEDEDTVRTIAQRVLERAGFRVLTARHGADALRVLGESDGAVDVLLSDVIMPEIGGVELAVLARERVPGLPVILMSGYTDADIGPAAENGLVNRFLQKPFNSKTLLDVVHSVTRVA
jgi:CheY-like chemotaxis protein